MSPCRNLLDLDGDILHLILQRLDAISPASIHSLVRVSRACYRLAYPVLCRSISLPSREWWSDREKNVTQDLLNRNHEISRHVRELVMPYSLGPDGLSILTILRILDNVQMLRSVRWHSQSKVPERLISKLEQRWPDLKLHVDVPYRSEGSLYPDIRLLSSPLLSSLECDISWGLRDGMFGSQESVLSDIWILAAIISQNKRLESLNLAISGCGSGFDDDPELEITQEVVPLDTDTLFPAGFQLPQLQEIVWPSWTYSTGIPQFEREHEKVHELTYILLKQIPNWAHLKYLKLSGLSAELPFKQLEGCVPNLRVLHVVFRAKKYDNTPAALSFISSLNGLEELSIINMVASAERCWEAIKKHKGSLCKVAVYSPPNFFIRSMGGEYAPVRKRAPLLTPEQLEELLTFRNITDLKIDISVEDAEWLTQSDILSSTVRNEKFENSRAAILTKFTHLRRLRLNIEVHEEASLFSDGYGDPVRFEYNVAALRAAQAKKAAVGLLKQIFANDPQSCLKEIKLKFETVALNDIISTFTPVDCSFLATRFERDMHPGRQVQIVGNGIRFHVSSRNPQSGWVMF
ncbi:F-box domain-containing protein [Phlyctema vagabunda]|uniref:F-box domain-containing protein n=1 Tax=Phlyctema vagabunda TaxID=108571 RepID=A0ABR4P6X2_9HELO